MGVLQIGCKWILFAVQLSVVEAPSGPSPSQNYAVGGAAVAVAGAAVAVGGAAVAVAGAAVAVAGAAALLVPLDRLVVCALPRARES